MTILSQFALIAAIAMTPQTPAIDAHTELSEISKASAAGALPTPAEDNATVGRTKKPKVRSPSTTGPNWTPASGIPPLVALWLAVRTKPRPFIMQPSDKQGSVERWLTKDLARRYGLAFVLPRFSDPIIEAVSFARVTAGDTDSFLGSRASRGADAVLAGRMIETSDDLWTVKWSLGWQGIKHRWQGEPMPFQQALTDGVAEAVKLFGGATKSSQ